MTKQPDPRVVSRSFCHKLECMEDFLKNYSSSKTVGGDCYLELFAKFAQYKCRESGTIVPGLSDRVLTIKPRFRNYIFAMPDTLTRDNLPDKEVTIITGNVLYESVQRQIFDRIPRSSNILCIVEPPGYRRLRWSVVTKLIIGGTNWQGYRMDMLMVLPLENALFKNMGRTDCINSINRFFGTQEWQDTASDLAKGQASPSEARLKLINLYAEKLKGEGYRHVEIFNPLRDNRIPPYFIIWASDRDSRIRQIKNIWQTPRFLPGEMFHKSL
jgi:three-Cys-motif partner protein